MSSDASCQSLRSPKDGPLLLELAEGTTVTVYVTLTLTLI